MKRVGFCSDGEINVHMGTRPAGPMVKVSVEGREFEAQSVDVGNPHAVVLVDDLSEAGDLQSSPGFDAADFPEGVNVEFVVRRGDRALALRVFERGVGETPSCGTGACAVVAAVAAARQTGRRPRTGSTSREGRSP